MTEIQDELIMQVNGGRIDSSVVLQSMIKKMFIKPLKSFAQASYKEFLGDRDVVLSDMLDSDNPLDVGKFILYSAPLGLIEFSTGDSVEAAIAEHF